MLTAGIRSSWDTQDGIRQTGTLQAQGDGTADVIISNDKTFMSSGAAVPTLDEYRKLLDDVRRLNTELDAVRGTLNALISQIRT